MRRVRVGSRRSALAQAQARLVMDAVRAGHPDVEFELVTVQTTGDVNMKPFSEASDPFGIKGLFTRELEDALLRGELRQVVSPADKVNLFLGKSSARRTEQTCF